MIKNFYKKLIEIFINVELIMYKTRTWFIEWFAILRKQPLYKNIKMSNKQKESIKIFWKENYGRIISTRWHKLYQSINDIFNEKYIPDVIFSVKIEPYLNPIKIARFISDKSLTELIYNSVTGIKFPETIIINSSGFYYDKSRNVISLNNAINILSLNDEFVIKPILGGSSGQGVKIISLKKMSEMERFKIILLVLKKYKKNFIVQRRLKAHPTYAKLYPDSINTIRLITYIINDEIFHSPLSLRMGNGGRRVDNIHAGGIVVALSDDGILDQFGYKLGYADSKIRYKEHPDTNIQFKGYILPKTIEMIALAKQLHSHTPHLGIVSWDFTIDDLNNVVLVEGNYNAQSMWFPQIVHGKPIFGNNTESMLQLISKRHKTTNNRILDRPLFKKYDYNDKNLKIIRK